MHAVFVCRHHLIFTATTPKQLVCVLHVCHSVLIILLNFSVQGTSAKGCKDCLLFQLTTLHYLASSLIDAVQASWVYPDQYQAAQQHCRLQLVQLA